MSENWETKNGKFLENVAIQFNNYMANTFYGIDKNQLIITIVKLEESQLL